MPHPRYQATPLANLGAAERDTGELQAAIAHMREGLEIRRRLNRPVDFADDLAHLTLAYLILGDKDTVRRLSDELCSALQAVSLDIFMPEFAFWVAAQAFRAGGQTDRSRGMLEKAHEIVLKQASAITQARNRQNYLELGVNHDIEAAYEHDTWPTLRSIGHGQVTANS
jgi:tetratricopeptide (TPR) repeat protein